MYITKYSYIKHTTFFYFTLCHSSHSAAFFHRHYFPLTLSLLHKYCFFLSASTRGFPVSIQTSSSLVEFLAITFTKNAYPTVTVHPKKRVATRVFPPLINFLFLRLIFFLCFLFVYTITCNMKKCMAS